MLLVLFSELPLEGAPNTTTQIKYFSCCRNICKPFVFFCIISVVVPLLDYQCINSEQPDIRGGTRRSVRGSMTPGVNQLMMELIVGRSGFAHSSSASHCPDFSASAVEYGPVRTAVCVSAPAPGRWAEKLREVSPQTLLPLSSVAVVSIPGDSDRMQGEEEHFKTFYLLHAFPLP